MKLVALEDSFYTLFIIAFINKVRLANSNLIWNQFAQKFYDNFSY